MTADSSAASTSTPPGARTRRSPLRLALAIGLALVLLTLGAGIYFYLEPARIGIVLSRSGLERGGLAQETVDTSVGEQTYFAGGQGDPTLVFLHGVGTQAGSWVGVAGDLARDHRVVAVDLAGHGDSAPREGTLDLPLTVDALDAVLEAASPRTPVVLVGNSFGGWVSLTYALQRPERVARLVLVSSAGVSGPVRTDLTLTPSTREEMTALLTAVGFDEVPAGFVLDDLVEEIAAGPTPRLMQTLGADDLLDGRLGALPMPIDLVWGQDDRLTSLAVAERLLDELPDGARLTVLEDCGHIPQQQCPQRFVATVRELTDGGG
ncbi:MAG: alpha/beta fold hydrolase [Acidobacteriota bacterium]